MTFSQNTNDPPILLFTAPQEWEGWFRHNKSSRFIVNYGDAPSRFFDGAVSSTREACSSAE